MRSEIGDGSDFSTVRRLAEIGDGSDFSARETAAILFFEKSLPSPISPFSPATITWPPPVRRASSTASAIRLRVASEGISRSTTTSIECLRSFSSAGGSSTRQIWPSTRARVKPCRTRSVNRSRCSPFASRTSGARIITRWSLRAARIRSTIWSRGWASKTLSHSEQWAVPIRAKSTRRKS